MKRDSTKPMIETQEFKPESYSPEKRDRLEDLLCAIEAAAQSRKSYVMPGRRAALLEWLAKPEVRNKKSEEYIKTYQAIAEERFSIYLDEILQPLFGDETAAINAQLQKMPVSTQQEAIAFMEFAYVRFIDPIKERKHWQQLSALYHDLLEEFPEILSNQDDIEGAIRLGRAIRRNSASLTDIWNKAAMPEQIKKAKSLLAEAYPDDNVEHLHIQPAPVEELGAAFHLSVKADTMVCGPLLSGHKKKKFWDFGLFLISHEFQHRRQLRQIEKLQNGALKAGSAAYYQARLYNAELEGGYLAPIANSSNISILAKMKDYLEQPIEQQANDIAALASRAGETQGAAIWAFNEKLNKHCTRLAAPFEKAVFNMKKAVWSLTGSNKPKGPGL